MVQGRRRTREFVSIRDSRSKYCITSANKRVVVILVALRLAPGSSSSDSRRNRVLMRKSGRRRTSARSPGFHVIPLPDFDPRRDAPHPSPTYAHRLRSFSVPVSHLRARWTVLQISSSTLAHTDLLLSLVSPAYLAFCSSAPISSRKMSRASRSEAGTRFGAWLSVAASRFFDPRAGDAMHGDLSRSGEKRGETRGHVETRKFERHAATPRCSLAVYLFVKVDLSVAGRRA